MTTFNFCPIYYIESFLQSKKKVLTILFVINFGLLILFVPIIQVGRSCDVPKQNALELGVMEHYCSVVRILVFWTNVDVLSAGESLLYKMCFIIYFYGSSDVACTLVHLCKLLVSKHY